MHKKILIIANDARSVINFRLHFLHELLKKKFNICVCTPYDVDSFKKLEALGVKLIPISIRRSGINPFVDFISCLKLFRIIAKEKPDISMNYTIKPVIYGSLSSRLLNVQNVFSMISGF